MNAFHPKPPSDLNPLAAEVLQGLTGQPAAAEIIIGGGVALQHYCPYRGTRDLDVWWQVAAREETERLLEEVLRTVARNHGLAHGRRAFGDTQSYELLDGARKVFAVKIALRTVALDPPLPSAWPPVGLETLRDNLGAKMNALVGRGAPRDFTDVFEVCARGLATPNDCWESWHQKNPDQNVSEGRARVLHNLEQIELRRPLAGIETAAERDRAARVRHWVRAGLCHGGDA